MTQPLFLTLQVFHGKDACVTPVLNMEEAPHHPHNASKGSFLPSPYTPGNYIPRPAPLLSRTPATVHAGVGAPSVGEHTTEVLLEAGFSKEAIVELLKKKIVMEGRKKANL